MSEMRIAFVTPYDPEDVTQASGTGYHIVHALRANGIDPVLIGPLEYPRQALNVIQHGWHRFVLRKNDHPQRYTGFLKHLARQVERKIVGQDVELVVGSGGLPLAYLETDLPVVLWTDCTFRSLVDYYANFSNLSSRTLRMGEAAERRLFSRVDHVIMTSGWARDSAVRDYGYDPARIDVIPRGANTLDRRTWEDAQALLESRPQSPWRVLFLGKDWKRKRGDLALEVVEELRRRGRETELVVMGEAPAEIGKKPYVQNLGFVNKGTEEGRRKFAEVMGGCHVLLLPTKADCTPISFCEAHSFATPVVSTRTGAIPNVVVEGETAALVDVEAGAGEFADAVERIVGAHDYRAWCERSFREYDTRLNWDVSGRRAAEVLRKVAARGKVRTRTPAPEAQAV